MTYRFNYF